MFGMTSHSALLCRAFERSETKLRGSPRFGAEGTFDWETREENVGFT